MHLFLRPGPPRKRKLHTFFLSLILSIAAFGLGIGVVYATVTISQNIQIGSGTPDLTLDGDDLYVTGTAEVDGALAAKTGGAATFIVAASDASTRMKNQADYVADGTADDVQIQAAIDALPAAGGKVLLSEGTFTLAPSTGHAINITNGSITLEGQGPSTLLNLQTANGTGDRYTIYLRGTAATPITGIIIRNLAIKGAGSNADASINTSEKHGIMFEQVRDLTIENILLFDLDEEAIQGFDTGEDGLVERVIINNIHAHDIGGAVVDLSSNTIKEVIVNNIIARDVMVNAQQAGEGVIQIWSSASQSITPPTDVQISNIIIDRTTQGDGIRFAGPQRIQMNNILLLDIARRGLYINTPASIPTVEDHTISNVIIRNAGSNNQEPSLDFFQVNFASLSGISIYGAYGDAFSFRESQFITGTNLLARSSQGNSNTDGVILDDSPDVIISGLIVDNHTGTGSRGVRVLATSDRFRLSNFIITNSISQGIWANADNGIFRDGYLANNNANVFVDGSGNKFRDVEGYVTTNSGTSTIASGNTSIAITHGLAVTPAAGDCTFVGAENPTNTVGTSWIDTYTSTQMTLNVENDPGASNFDVNWTCAVY